MMQEHGNVLILDEPTNHLDLSSKEAIETALQEYTGTVIFVSHDRYLLSKIADRLIELTDGGYREHNYGFEKYLDVLRSEQAEEKRIAELEKTAKAVENAKEKQAKTYRSKQQRSADTARKNEMKRLEKEIDDFQMRIDSLTEEIAKEEVYTNYEIDELKRKIDDNFDKLIELDSE